MAINLIDEIINRSDIVDIIGKFVSLHKSGANYFGLCPFHPDTNPSMSVSPKKKIFKCFSCGASGNVITFIQRYKKISYGEAVREAAKLAGFNDSVVNEYFNKQNKSYSQANWKLFTLNADANELFKQLLFDEDNKKYLQYLLDRKLSEDIIKKFDIGFCGKNDAKQICYDLLANKKVNPNAKWNEDDLLKTSLININEKTFEINDYFYNRITFPIKDRNGFIVGFIARDINLDTELKYLSSRETTLFSKSNILYNMDKVFQEKPETLVVLEGNIDLITLYESGMNEATHGAVALMGTALTRNHVQMIAKSGFIKNIVLWFDNDAAGAKSTIVNGLQFLKTGLNVVVVNNNTKYKDVNEIMVKESKKKVLDLLLDPSKPSFISYYISKKLVDLTSTNIDSKVEEVLALINKYGKTLHFKAYVNQIASLTKLDPEDIVSAYKKISTNRFLANKEYEWNRLPTPAKKVINDPIYKNLVEAFNILMNSIIYKPQFAETIYSELVHKKTNHPIINDFLYLIKTLSLESWDDKDHIQDVEKIILTLDKNQKISSNGSKALIKILDNMKVRLSSNLPMKVNKSNVKIQAQHIDYYCNLIEKDRLMTILKDKNISKSEQEKVTSNLEKIRKDIKLFEKSKSKRFI